MTFNSVKYIAYSGDMVYKSIAVINHFLYEGSNIRSGGYPYYATEYGSLGQYYIHSGLWTQSPVPRGSIDNITTANLEVFVNIQKLHS